MIDVAALYALLDKAWPWDEASYPVIARLRTADELLAFKLHHALGHLHKSVGRIEAMLEALDHGGPGGPLRGDAAATLIGKALVDVVQIANVAGIEPALLRAKPEAFFVRNDRMPASVKAEPFRGQPLDARLVLQGLRVEADVLRGTNVRGCHFRLTAQGCDVTLFGGRRVFVPGVVRVEVFGYEAGAGVNAFVRDRSGEGSSADLALAPTIRPPPFARPPPRR